MSFFHSISFKYFFKNSIKLLYQFARPKCLKQIDLKSFVNIFEISYCVQG